MNHLGRVIAIVCLLLLPWYGAKAYSDVPAGTISAVETLRSRGIVSGYPDGTFRPHAYVTRAEFAKMVALTFPQGENPRVGAHFFRDVSRTDWFDQYVRQLYVHGVVSGFMGGLEFRPYAHVTRAEALKIALVAMRVPSVHIDRTMYGWEQTYPEYRYVAFSDVPRASWYAKYVLYTFDHDVLASNDRFRPADPLTRAEAASLLVKLEAQKERLLTRDGTVQEAVAGWEETPLLADQRMEDDFREVVLKEEELVWKPQGVVSVPTSPVVQTDDPAPMQQPGVSSVPAVSAQQQVQPKQSDLTQLVQAEQNQPQVILPCAFHEQQACTEAERRFFLTGELDGRYTQLDLVPATAQKFVRPQQFLEQTDAWYAAYQQQLGAVPFDGKKVRMMELCAYREGITYANHLSVVNEACPQGYMWFAAWGLADNPVKITSSGWATIAQDHNAGRMTFGVVHELAHVFDHASANRQYNFDSTSTEAIANLRLVLAMEQVGQPVVLNGTVYAHAAELRGMYLRAYQRFVANQGTFSSLLVNSPIPGSLTDAYLGFWFAVQQQEGFPDTVYAQLQQLYAHGEGIRIIAPTDREGRFVQKVVFMSCLSRKNMLPYAAVMGVTIPEVQTERVAQCVDHLSDAIPLLDAGLRDAASTKDDVAQLRAYADEHDLDTKDYVLLGTYPILPYTLPSGIGEALALDPVTDRVYVLPWFFLEYLSAHPDIASALGSPKSTWTFSPEVRKWVQHFQHGVLQADSDPGAAFTITVQMYE